LTGKKFLPIWIVFYLIVLIPYALCYKSLIGQTQTYTNPSPLFGLVFLAIMIAAIVISFFIIKILIENVNYRGDTVGFHGKFGSYLGKILLGMLLSIITLSIYMAWFVKDITRFIVDNSSFRSVDFQFMGKGGKLFVIFLLTLFLPIIVLSIFMGKYLVTMNQNFILTLVFQGAMMIILVPYMYYVYKWMVDIHYKDYTISWETDFWPSCGKIAMETILILVTLGIYMPLAMVRLYKYFVARTVAVSSNNKLRFDYEIDQLNDFLFIWGQLLLTLITIGIYYPWAICKIGKRILGKTYLGKK